MDTTSVRVSGFGKESGHGEIPYVPSTVLLCDEAGKIIALGEWNLKTTRRWSVGVDEDPDGWRFLPELLEWQDDHVLLVDRTGKATYEMIDVAERALVRFAETERKYGHKMLNDPMAYSSAVARSFHFHAAHEHFDLARRVSNEPDDYVRVWWTAKPETQNALEDAFEDAFAGIDCRERAHQLFAPVRFCPCGRQGGCSVCAVIEAKGGPVPPLSLHPDEAFEAGRAKGIEEGRLQGVKDPESPEPTPTAAVTTPRAGEPGPAPWTDHPMPELDLHLRTRASAARLEYEARNCIWRDGVALYECDNEGMTDRTEEIEKATILLRGRIRFDGCSHNYFAPVGEDDDGGAGAGYIHGCSRFAMARLGTLFFRLFDLAAEMMPKWKENFS